MAQHYLRKYGAAATIDFELFEIDGVDFRVDAVHASGDTKVMKDEGAEANTTNAFTDEGQGYSLVLTATEMQAARVVIYIVDSATKAWLDTMLVIETYGNASAQHAVDLDDSVRMGLSALPNAAADAAGGLTISDAGGLDLDTQLAATNEVTAARMAALTDWINGGRLDLLLDAIKAVTDNLPDSGSLNDLASILTDTGTTIPALLPTALVGGRMDATVDATGFEQGAIDNIWDEVLTGATHNVVNSAGRRIRALQEFQGYALGAVWIDTVNGTAGTSDFENGTVNNPVLSLADAITLASSLNLKRFVVTPGSSITFAEAHIDELWVGTSWTLALGGQDCSKTTISGAAISGTATSPTGEIHLDECEVGTTTIGQTHFRSCNFDATVTLSAAAIYLFENCSLGGTSCIIDLGAAVGNTHVDISRWSGSLELQNVGQTGTDAVDLDGAGELTINVNCVGGEIDIHGFWDITDNGSSTISRAGITDDVTSILGDTAGIAGSAMRGTDNAALASVATEARMAELDAANLPSDLDAVLVDTGTTIPALLPAALVSGRMDSDIGAKTGNVALSAQEKLDVNVEADTALTDYDAPTKAEMDTAHALLATPAQVNTEVDNALDTAIPGSPTADSVNERIVAIDDKLPSGNIGGEDGIAKNAAFSDFEFLMIDSTDDVSPKTGLTVTGERSIDGGAFASVSGTIAEVANGIYQFDALAADTNGDVITWRFSASGANDRFFTFKTVS